MESHNEEGFEVYFQGGLRSDEYFNAQEYWLSIPSRGNLSLILGVTSPTIRNPVLRVLHKMVSYGLCQRTIGDLDTTTLKVLIDSKDRLIPEASQPGVPRVAIPRPQRASMQDLYEKGYVGVFEHMAGVYSVSLHEAYNLPRYDQQQYDQYYQQNPLQQQQQQPDDDDE
ncbi:hypothetical protein Tco_0923054 [Tanacetum coccineum]|uniref:Uncharacterized protein n=1 Tax=Tanacetum coccineum TaxID=301880 RepID=A0ABQ5D168_9ASTR